MVYFGISALLIFPLCFVNSNLANRLRRQTFKDTHYIDESDFIKAVMCTECHSDPRCNGVRDYLICAHKCYDKQTPNVEVNSCSNLFECQDHCSYNPHYIPGPNECDRVFDCL
uniref:Uncharacterized protein n=1 Tax=Ciona savignyi TaxID=51511 RepID=H2Z586_CIOSA